MLNFRSTICYFKSRKDVQIMTKLRSIGTAVGLTALLAAPIMASGNLLTNGGFESTPALTNSAGGWGFFSPDQVDGWDTDGNNIEIWSSGFGGVNADEGEQFAELNAHPKTGSAFTLFQDIVTNIGQSYELSFAYRARSGSGTESFNVAAGDLSLDIANTSANDWTTYSGIFTASSETTRLLFTSVSPETNTFGNFLDDVSVIAKVPEPGSLALLGLGLAGLGLSRRRKS
ncbi:DUF642 domain-containing protein [Marinobacter sp. F3R08]|nr:DUF642 domain-containing protein [Marinobacter sp. F3R08]